MLLQSNSINKFQQRISRMTSPPSESIPIDSAPHTTQIDRITLKRGLMTVATVFGLFFLMGFCSAWLQGEGAFMNLAMRGLKFGASGSIAVICMSVSAKTWRRLPVPAWLPSTASFAVGFFVMNGLGEVFDGRDENILSKAGGGFLLGACIGLGIHLAQKKGRGPKGTSGTSEQNTTTGSGK
jgi:hypothetical protein